MPCSVSAALVASTVALIFASEVHTVGPDGASAFCFLSCHNSQILVPESQLHLFSVRFIGASS